MILSYENIEHIAAGVAKDFCCAIHAGEKKYEINIDRLAKAYLGLEVSYRTLSDDGSVLGVTAYRDAEYAVNAGDVMKIIPLKSNQVLLDRSLAVFSDNVAGTRRRRFTLAHECAHCSSLRPRRVQQLAESPMRCAWRADRACCGRARTGASGRPTRLGRRCSCRSIGWHRPSASSTGSCLSPFTTDTRQRAASSSLSTCAAGFQCLAPPLQYGCGNSDSLLRIQWRCAHEQNKA